MSPKQNQEYWKERKTEAEERIGQKNLKSIFQSKTKKKEKSGSHNLVIEPGLNYLVFPKDGYKKQSIHKYFSVQFALRKKEKGSRNQANEPKVISRSSFTLRVSELYKYFDKKGRSWVGGIRQTRLPEEQVTSRSSGFKDQQGLRIPGPAPILFTFITIYHLLKNAT